MLLSSLRFCLGGKKTTLYDARASDPFRVQYTWYVSLQLLCRTSYPTCSGLGQRNHSGELCTRRWQSLVVDSLLHCARPSSRTSRSFWWWRVGHMCNAHGVELGSQGWSHMLRKLEDFPSTGSIIKQRWLRHKLLMNRTLRPRPAHLFEVMSRIASSSKRCDLWIIKCALSLSNVKTFWRDNKTKNKQERVRVRTS